MVNCQFISMYRIRLSFLTALYLSCTTQYRPFIRRIISLFFIRFLKGWFNFYYLLHPVVRKHDFNNIYVTLCSNPSAEYPPCSKYHVNMVSCKPAVRCTLLTICIVYLYIMTLFIETVFQLNYVAGLFLN